METYGEIMHKPEVEQFWYARCSWIWPQPTKSYWPKKESLESGNMASPHLLILYTRGAFQNHLWALKSKSS